MGEAPSGEKVDLKRVLQTSESGETKGYTWREEFFGRGQAERLKVKTVIAIESQ